MCEHSLLSNYEHQSGWFSERDSLFECPLFLFTLRFTSIFFNAGSKGEPSRKDSSVNSESLR